MLSPISPAATLLLLTSSLACARVYEPLVTIGASYGPSQDPQQAEMIVESNEHPNATRSVAFTPFGDSDPSVQWTWRVNVSDIAVPDANGSTAIGLDEPHITNTAYDFQWPGNVNFSTALDGMTAPVCITVLDGISPALFSRYTEADENGTDCSPVFGAKCVDALLNSIINGDECFSPSVDVPACKTTLGRSGSVNSVTFNINYKPVNSSSSWNGSATSGSTADPYGFDNGRDSGWGFFSASTSPYSAANTTAYHYATSQLQMMLLTGPGPKNGGGNLSQALCMRVNTTDMSSASGSSASGASSTSNTGAASAMRASVFAPMAGSLAMMAVLMGFL